MMDEQAEKKETFGEKVMDAVSSQNPTKVVPINFPRKTFKRFNKWAFENAGNCYWLAIEKLMDNYDRRINIQQEVKLLADRDDFVLFHIQEMQEEIETLKAAVLAAPKATPKKRTFGRQEMNGDENGNQ